MTYRQARAEDKSSLLNLLEVGFRLPSSTAEPWVDQAGLSRWRLLDQGGPVGCLLPFEMGQWFGGCVVSTVGVAGVAVAPAGRGRGVGQRLMRETLKEHREKGVALCTLFGSTTSFYRRLGFERAGGSYTTTLQLRTLSHRGGPLTVRPLDKKGHMAAEALQGKSVRHDGALKRIPYIWHRVRTPRMRDTNGVGFFREDVLEGYSYQVRAGMDEDGLELTDLVLTTPEAVQTFLGYLAGHRAFYREASWRDGPECRLALCFEEPWCYRHLLQEHWLLRLVHLPNALAGRGYPSPLQGRLELHVTDSALPENAGPWRLELENGKMSVIRGGTGEDLDVDAGALASLYTGFRTPWELVTVGRARGTEHGLALAAEMFRGTPSLRDRF